MSVDITFHYPPELMNLLIDTIPLLNRSKNDVFLFFRGAGVSNQLVQQPYQQWQRDKNSINKYEIVREVLSKLNEKGEVCLRERREVLKRVVEFESFSSCWPADHLKALGLVAEIQKVVNVKDSFTRMTKEREAERQGRIAQIKAEHEMVRKKEEQIIKIKDELFALFSETNPQKRGKVLEGILNRLFKANGVLVREAFTLVGDDDEGVVEQIDGVVEMVGHMYFVEMKWWNKPLGRAEVSEHLVRVYTRAEGRAIIISASNFTAPAISVCKDALQQKVIVLCTLQELVMLLEQKGDLVEFFKKKVQAAIADRNPFIEVRT